MTTAAAPRLADDLRRMAPVWIIVVATALAIALGIRYAGVAHLRRAASNDMQACNYSAVYTAAADQRLGGIRELAAAIRLNARRFDEPSLGSLAGNPTLATATEELRRAIELCPENAIAHRTLALVHWYEGNEADSYLSLAEFETRDGRPEEALDLLRTTREMLPGDPRVPAALMQALLRTQRFTEATSLLEKERALLLETSAGRLAAGVLLAGTGKDEEALALLRAALPENPTSREAIGALYNIALRQGTEVETADSFESIAADGRRVTTDIHTYAAALYRRKGDASGEEKALRNALALFPNSAVIHWDLTLALHRQGKVSAARDQANEALQHDASYVLGRIQATGVDPR